MGRRSTDKRYSGDNRLDGKIARKYNLVSDFGKFLDPIADKLLVVSVLMGFISVGLASSVAVILIVAREFLISGLRMQAAAKGEVIAASIWGKIKTGTHAVIVRFSAGMVVGNVLSQPLN